jgi:hypothetical protein
LFSNPLEIWKSAEESLDFQLTWRVVSNLTLTFDAVNLTAPIFHENYGDQPMLFNFYNNYYSRTWAVGARYQFRPRRTGNSDWRSDSLLSHRTWARPRAGPSPRRPLRTSGV